VLDGMAPGGVVVVHSTIAPASVIAPGEAAAERGLWLLDAPVSGGRAGALAGTMALMVGGAAVAIEAVRPVLAAFATNIVHVGPLGAGQSVKLINNGVSFANMVIVIEALRAARELGFDWRAVADVIRVSSGASTALVALQTASALEKMASPTNNIQKDVGHLRELLRSTSAADAVLLEVADQATGAVKAFALQQQEALGA
jgi:3-hydroxyisobutyrate dehydrogenase